MQGTGMLKRFGVVCLSALMILVAGCSGSGGSAPSNSKGDNGAPAQKGGKLIVGRSQPSDTLDPAATIAGPSWEIFRLIYSTLVTKTKDGFEGNLAEKWDVTTDAKTWTFTLRKDQVFSNGDPVNADAVAFTFNRILDPKTKAPSRGFLGPLDKVEKVDDYTVKFIMSQPFALLLDNLAIEYFGIVDPKAVAKSGADYGRNPVGSGPWKLKEWVTGDRIVLVPNEQYKGFHSFLTNKAKPFADELVFREIPQIETQLAALQSGEINFVSGLPGDKASQFKGRTDIKLLTSERSTAIAYLGFGMNKAAAGQTNSFKAPFDDIKVRQAMGYAVDANQIIDKVLYGFGVRNGTPMPTGNFGYDPGLKQYGFEFNLQKANQLLDEANWKMGADNIRQKDGKKLEVSFWALNSSGMGDVAQVIQSQLAKVGMKANVTALDVATYTARVATSDMQLELISVGWSSPNILNIMTTLGWGTGLYNEKGLTDLLNKAQSTPDAAQRKQLYAQTQQMMLTSAILVP
ncbi:MAG: extracellular solute-binding protein family 5, partial [Firmicutes bacterium]|nr:extracellular solute-binding protein family 5 [Bacillota bacterium]